MAVSLVSVRIFHGANPVNTLNAALVGEQLSFVFTFDGTIQASGSGVVVSGSFISYTDNNGAHPPSGTTLTVLRTLKSVSADVGSITAGVHSGLEDTLGNPLSFPSMAVTDSSGSTLQIQLGDAPEIITGSGDTAAYSIAENTTSVADVDSTDDGATEPSSISYSITGGDDSTHFAINASTGLLTFKTAPNFENPQDTNGDGTYTVEVTVTDVVGQTDTQTISVQVQDANDAPTGSVTISGTPTEDEVLTAANTLADEDGLGTIAYQWRRDGVDIAGATGTTYTLTQADVGAGITVTANYTDARGTAESATSASTAAVANVNDDPTGSVTISGTVTENEVLTAANTLADEDGLGTIAYQWRRDGVDIAGATGTTYTLTQADAGAKITVTASYTDARGTAESVTSAATAPVVNINRAPTNTVPLAQTMAEDSSLTFSAANGNPLSIADSDAGAGSVTSTLSVSSGSLSVATGGGAALTGNGTATVTITGTVSDVNTALASVTYVPLPDYYGNVTLTLATDDGGNSGAGGAQTDTDTVAITVYDVFDSTATPLDTLGPLEPLGPGFSVRLGDGSPVSGTQDLTGGSDGGQLSGFLAAVLARISDSGASSGFVAAKSLLPTYEGLGLPVRTIVLSAPGAASADIIGEISVNGGSLSELLIIDATGLPEGTVITLDNALAALVSGPVVLTGGLGETTLFAGYGAQSATLGPNNDVLFGGPGDDTIGSLGGFDVLNGEAGDDTLSGGDDSDRLLGTAGSDHLNGEAGDDWIIVTGGDHIVDGGDGADTLVLNGAHADATVTVATGGAVTVSGQVSSGGAFTAAAVNVETIVFSDAVLSFATDADDPAGQVLRLYQGIFGRDPDTAGAAAHIGLLDSGATTLGAIAQAFLQSGEFLIRFGALDSLSDEAFVTLLYQNVLGRAPDEAGLAHHVALLGPDMSRGDLASAFTQSAEFIEATSSLAAQGVLAARAPVVTGTAASEKFQGCYFDDTVDGGAGIDTFTIAALRSEVTLTRSADGSLTLTDTLGLIGTDQLTGIERIQFLDGTLAFSPIDVPAQVNLLTQVVLDRDATPAELSTAVDSLDAGTSSLKEIAARLLADPDFAGQSTTLDNSALVSLFYTNGLERAPDSAGLAQWTAELNAGLAPADLAVIIATSGEATHFAATGPDDGLSF